MSLTPYYEAPHVTIYCGDAREVLPELETAGLEIAGLITDPPYLNYQYVCEAGFTEPFDHVRDGEWWTAVTGFHAHWLPTCVSHLTGLAWLFLDTRYLPVLLRLIHICRWSATDYYLVSPEEMIVQCGGVPADAATYAALLDILGTQNRYGQDKPPALLDALVARIPKQAGVILDPFMGGGSTLIAGLKAGWPVMGIEREAATCTRAVQAIQAVQAVA